MPDMLDNMPRGTIVIEDLEIGMTRHLWKTITDEDIEMFAAASVFAQPYRSGYLAIIDGATLGAHPEYLH